MNILKFDVGGCGQEIQPLLLSELRCANCAKLLGRGAITHLIIRCPRCGQDNLLRANEPQKREPRKGLDCAKSRNCA